MLAPRDKLWSAPEYVATKALEQLHLRPDDVVVDYGCGDGVALLAAVQNCGVRKAVGYEIHAERAAELRARVAELGLSESIEVKTLNALEADPKEPTAVYMYLIERGLKLMLENVLRAAAAARPDKLLRVVTVLNRIPVAGVEPVSSTRVRIPGKADMVYPVYVYHITPESGLSSGTAGAAAAGAASSTGSEAAAAAATTGGDGTAAPAAAPAVAVAAAAVTA